MRADRDAPVEGPVVRGFANKGFALDSGVYRGLLLTPASAHEWDPPELAELGPDDFGALFDLNPTPEFLLLGTGERMAFPSRALKAALEARDIGIEAMDSRAAARTWGMLRGEGRWIVAALMPLG